MTTIAVIAPGAMGAGIGLHLGRHGARVVTSLDGRSAASRSRAAAAGMADASLGGRAAGAGRLSIVPPADAVALAERLAPAIGATRRKPVFVDCNAISPATAERVRTALARTGAPVVDGCIIGIPPKPEGKSPAVFVSGDPDRRTAVLAEHGLDLRPMDAPFGAASGLKLAYAGVTKGLTGLGAAMLLAAAREGLGPALDAELLRSQPELRNRFAKAMPDMLPKAYRWVAEMREIAAFLGPDDPAALIYEGVARLYERLADDRADRQDLERTLLAAVAPATAQ